MSLLANGQRPTKDLSMLTAKVLILYNEPVLPDDHPDVESEHEVLDTRDAVQKALLDAGFEVECLGVNRDPGELVAGLQRSQPDVVFNLFEGTGDYGETEAFAAGVLHWLNIPFTGSPAETLCLARHKHLAKQLLRGAGLPTPDYFVAVDPKIPPCPLRWPVIVKPALQDASVGMDMNSVVKDQESLEKRIEYLIDRFGPPVLVEQFIRGREFNVGLIEAPDLRVLPISEITFTGKGRGFWPIVTYDGKWRPGTSDYELTPPIYPAQVDPELTRKVEGLAIDAFRALGCRDYARVDFRVRPSGKPYILEVNPNPDFSPIAGLAGGLASASLTHADFTVQLVRNALARAPRLAKA